MPALLRSVLAVLVGVVAGGAVNSAIVMFGPRVIPPPPGVDMTTAEGITAALPLLEPRHFAAPFLAHALGTLVGAGLAAMLVKDHDMRVAMVIGVVFLAGGIAASRMIPAPTWFIVLDLVAAYIPMAWLGVQAARAIKR